MDMRMVLQFLVPRVKHTEEADIGSQKLRVACHLEQRFRTAAEQKVVQNPLVLQRQRGQFMRQSEDNMHVRCRQQLAFPCFDPPVPCIGLTPRAMPVTAGVKGDSLMAAGCALIDVSAESGRTASLDGSQHFQMQPVEPVPISIDKLSPCVANQISHLHGWPLHQLLSPPVWLLSLAGFSDSPSSGLAVLLSRRLERCR